MSGIFSICDTCWMCCLNWRNHNTLLKSQGFFSVRLWKALLNECVSFKMRNYFRACLECLSLLADHNIPSFWIRSKKTLQIDWRATHLCSALTCSKLLIPAVRKRSLFVMLTPYLPKVSDVSLKTVWLKYFRSLQVTFDGPSSSLPSSNRPSWKRCLCSKTRST